MKLPKEILDKLPVGVTSNPDDFELTVVAQCREPSEEDEIVYFEDDYAVLEFDDGYQLYTPVRVKQQREPNGEFTWIVRIPDPACIESGG